MQAVVQLALPLETREVRDIAAGVAGLPLCVVSTIR
jgi:hypothetical protein